MFSKIIRFLTETTEEREARKSIEKKRKEEVIETTEEYEARKSREEKKRKEEEEQVEYERSVERANRINREESMRCSYFQSMGQSKVSDGIRRLTKKINLISMDQYIERNKNSLP